MIDIIIPIYNSRKYLPRTLYSILMQDELDKINVVIIDDCSLEPCDDIIEKFQKKMNIQYIKLEKNGGPGVARQEGIDRSNGKYICFLDSDDVLYDCMTIKNILRALDGKEFDYANFVSIEEKTGKPLNIECLHGLVFNRAFLKKHDIRFPKTRAHEDVFYLLKANMFVRKRYKSKYILDVYTDSNEDSIIHSYDNYHFRTIDQFVTGMVDLVDYAYKHDAPPLFKIHSVCHNFGVIFLNYNYYLEAGLDCSDFLKKVKPALKVYEEHSNDVNEYYKIKYTYNAYNIDSDFGEGTPCEATLDEFIEAIKNA